MHHRFIIGVLVLAAAVRSAAAESSHCLNSDERRAVIRSHKVVPLARAIRRVQTRYPGDLVAVRLCQQGKRLFYVLTVLPHSGKVVHASVDAATGAIVDGS